MYCFSKKYQIFQSSFQQSFKSMAPVSKIWLLRQKYFKILVFWTVFLQQKFYQILYFLKPILKTILLLVFLNMYFHSNSSKKLYILSVSQKHVVFNVSFSS